MRQNSSILLIIVFSLFLLWSRWIPHEANLSPVLALFLMCGWLGQGRWYSLAFPFLGLFISDIYLGFYPGWVFNYVSFACAMFFGLSMKGNLTSFLTRGVGSVVLFYLVSNFGVWMTSGLYDFSGEGFFLCYGMALPFLKVSLMSTTLFLVGFYFLGTLFDRVLRGAFVFH